MSFSNSNSNSFTIFVDGLPPYMNSNWLRNLFKSKGEIVDVYISFKKRVFSDNTFGFIRFRYKHQATNAILSFDGKRVAGNVVRVKWARERSLSVRSTNQGAFESESSFSKIEEILASFKMDCLSQFQKSIEDTLRNKFEMLLSSFLNSVDVNVRDSRFGDSVKDQNKVEVEGISSDRDEVRFEEGGKLGEIISEKVEAFGGHQQETNSCSEVVDSLGCFVFESNKEDSNIRDDETHRSEISDCEDDLGVFDLTIDNAKTGAKLVTPMFACYCANLGTKKKKKLKLKWRTRREQKLKILEDFYLFQGGSWWFDDQYDWSQEVDEVYSSIDEVDAEPLEVEATRSSFSEFPIEQQETPINDVECGHQQALPVEVPKASSDQHFHHPRYRKNKKKCKVFPTSKRWALMGLGPPLMKRKLRVYRKKIKKKHMVKYTLDSPNGRSKVLLPK